MRLTYVLFYIFLYTNIFAQENIFRIKGIPFSGHNVVPISENQIDKIKSTNKNRFYLYDVTDSLRVKKIRKILKRITRKRNLINDSYDLRLGFYFVQGDTIIEKFYFDSHQRLLMDCKLYKPKWRDIKYIFSLLCRPSFSEILVDESKYWRYCTFSCNGYP
ncbi:hypothetical protein SAMN04515674_1331 [Pseudarcicella hirudinis]|uniref:Uncharacterized protein n=1 Tax=Pseudarcicella hirudinis TaxID=1079859 RepID=A0A1I5Z553_9BACT|nr:hypothetical protein [Pseudarcicella hirudinis]SFQ51592.1 hypothetical protein SAMN04515674_1331 [Pseudarcicella hirudinis]